MVNGKLDPTCYIVKNSNEDTIKIPVIIANKIIEELNSFSFYTIIQFEIADGQDRIKNHSSTCLFVFMPKKLGAKITNKHGKLLKSTIIKTSIILELANKWYIKK